MTLSAYARDKNALHQESLDSLRSFKVAIDAELLLSKVTQSNALKSVQDGHSSLDPLVQREIQDILSTFKTKYDIELVVVLDGLKPPAVSNEISSLKKSYAVWAEISKLS